MSSMDPKQRATRAIVNYRMSAWHDRHQGCCRFTPSCSRYAEDALSRRRLLSALVLIGWRLLRCNPLTAPGTSDPVRPRSRTRRRRLVGVLALSALTTLMVTWTASAVAAAAPGRSGAVTAGGCDLFVGGRPFNTLDRDHALQVAKGQRIVVTGRAPVNVRSLPDASLRATTTITVHFIVDLAKSDFVESTTGQNFQKSVNVDTYLKYGSGVYRVDAHSVAPGAWDCAATFYVELNGSKIIADIAILAGATGVAGALAASRAGEPTPDRDGIYDPTISPEELDRAQHPTPDRLTNARDDGTGCLFALLFGFVPGFFGAGLAAVPVGRDERSGRVRVHGHAVRGFASGLFAGVGIAVAAQQFGLYPLTVTSAIVMPCATAVVLGFRAWWGRAWKL